MPAVPRIMALVDYDTCVRMGVDPRAAAIRAAGLGAECVALRARRLDGPTLRAWAYAVRDDVRALDAVLVAAGAAPGHGIGAVDGVHLPDDGVEASVIRERWPEGASVSVSTHDAASVQRAMGADWATLSPFGAIAARPGYGPALGLDGFAALAASAPCKVLALGGVRPEDLASLADAGAAGVAALTAFCAQDDAQARALVRAAHRVWGAP